MEVFIRDRKCSLQSEGGRLNGSHHVAQMIVHHGFHIVTAEQRLKIGLYIINRSSKHLKQF